jgi:DnaJ-class molecular chaperone
LSVPAFRLCPTCDGTGRTGFYACDDCAGRGMFQEQRQVDVIVPRNVHDGTVIPVSLRHLGVNGLYLNVHVRVSSAAPAWS